MSGGGGKGGSQTTQAEIPQWAEDAMIHNLGRAQQVAELGYMPYHGPDVAVFNPTQIAAMDSYNSAASAFGLGSPSGSVADSMPAPQDFGGFMGYSSRPMFQQAVNSWNIDSPAQTQQYSNLFVPMRGEAAPPVARPNQQLGMIDFMRGGMQ